jgi:hypothetical protein
MPRRGPTEHEIQRQILGWLKIKHIWHFRNNTAAVKLSYKGKGRFVKFGVPGSPDIYVLKEGRLFGLEVKSEKGFQSQQQNAFEVEFIRAGGIYGIVRTLEQAIALIGYRES